MKRFILLVICISICSSAIADSVTPQQAAKKAESFFSGGIPTKSGSSVKLIWTWPEVQTKASNGSDPLIYVFERDGGGFAIVAGEDAAHPILGYSATDSFSTTDMPDNLRSFLSWYGEVLQCARDNHWSASPEMREEWNRGMTLADLDNEQSVQLETAQWGQGSPYNDLCPVIDGVRCPSGCVATATAIIMRYHQWPKRGTGELPSYDYDYKGVKGHVDGYRLGHEYQWDNMPMKRPEGGYTEEQSGQIAQLLYDVGVMTKMLYSPYASGAYISNAGKGLLEYFDYDNSMLTARRFYTINLSAIELQKNWENIIRDEIQSYRPVLFTGRPAPGGLGEGHAFVIDGFKDNYFSINYGWGGGSCFFLLTPIDGHEEDLSNYYINQEMVYNIFPNNKQGDDSPNKFDFLLSTCFLNWDYVKRSFQFQEHLYLDVHSVKTDSICFEACLGHFDNQGNLLEWLSDPTSIVVSEPFRSFQVNVNLDGCKFRESVNDGDQLFVLYRYDEQQEWKRPDTIRDSGVTFDLHTPLTQLVTFGLTNDLSDVKRALCRTTEQLGTIMGSNNDWNSFIESHPEVLTVPSIILRVTKDPFIYCCLYSDSYQNSTSINENLSFYFNSPYQEIILPNIYLINSLIGHGAFLKNSNECSCRLWLEPGNYRLVLRKFNEEMTIRFKL